MRSYINSFHLPMLNHVWLHLLLGCTFCSAAAALWRIGALLHSSLLPKFPPRTRAQEALRASSFPINLTPTPGILAWNRERECQVWPLASPSSDPLFSPSDSSHLRAFFYLSSGQAGASPYIIPLDSSSPHIFPRAIMMIWLQ